MIRAILSVMLGFVLLASSVKAQGDVRKEIEAQYKRSATAYMREDLNGTLAILAADGLFKGAKGKAFTRDDIERNLKAQFASIETESLVFKIVSVRRVGQNVVCEVAMTQIFTPTNASGARGSRMKAEARTRDTWTRKGGTWVQAGGEVLGKPILVLAPAKTTKPAR